MITLLETLRYRTTLSPEVSVTTVSQARQTTTLGQPGPQGPIGPSDLAAITALSNAIGNTDHDFAADYTTAKA